MKTRVAAQSLPTIYKKLREPSLSQDGTGARRFCIPRFKYDDFIREWQSSLERQCIVANCEQYAADAVDDGRSLLPSRLCQDALDPIDTKRGEALAATAAEVIWVLISLFQVLPVLRISTPTSDIEEFLSEYAIYEQYCVILHFSSFGAFLIKVSKKAEQIDAYWKGAKLIGWLDEQHYAKYRSDHTEGPPDLHAVFGHQKLPGKDDRLVLPGYLSHPEYFEKHSSEIVAGYIQRQEKLWECTAVNGCDLARNATGNGNANAVKSLVGDSFYKSLEPNLFSFRPALLGETEDLTVLYEGQGLTERDWAGNIPIYRRFAVTQTYSLVPLEFVEVEPQEVASFFSCIWIDIPKTSEDGVKQLLAQRYSAVQADSRFEKSMLRLVNVLWENVDILKLPIMRQMLKETFDELKRTREAEVARGRSLAQSTSQLLDVSRQLSSTAGALSLIRGDHLAALHVKRHDLAMLFEAGSVMHDNGSFHLPLHDVTEFKSVEHLARTLVTVFGTMQSVKEEHRPKVGWVRSWHAQLIRLQEDGNCAELLMWLVPHQAWSRALAGGGGAVGAVVAKAFLRTLAQEWTEVVHTNRDPWGNVVPTVAEFSASFGAITSLKRRVHSIFKPAALGWDNSTDKRVTVGDLASYVHADFAVLTAAKVDADDAIFNEDTFPFRSIGEFLEVIWTLCDKAQVGAGAERKIRFEPNGAFKKIVIENVGDKTFLNADRLPQLIEDLMFLLKSREEDASAFILGNYLTPLHRLLRGVDASRVKSFPPAEIDGSLHLIFVCKMVRKVFYLRISGSEIEFGDRTATAEEMMI